MPDLIHDFNGVRVLECCREGRTVRTRQDAIDLIAEARSQQAVVVIVPTERLLDNFFQLKSGLAGEIIQKFVTYGLQLIVLGDISRHLNDSAALRDFVREANQGTHCWFVTNGDELGTRLQHRS